MANGNQITVGGFHSSNGMVTGWVSTAHINAQYVELRPVEQRSERTPSFEAWARGREGNFYHLGTLWRRKRKSNGELFHGGFITGDGPNGSMDVAIFGDFATGADMVSRTGDDDYVTGRAQTNGGDRRGGFSGGSTAGPGGEYVAPNGSERSGFGGDNAGGFADDLDDDVPF